MQHPEPHDITALAYGLIEGLEREQLLTHLSECDACRETYDSYREEQATIRDSVVRDARSGAAEAKALESTLRMLGAIEGDEKPRGRLLHLPRWILMVEVAAMLAVAAGLFFILKPTDEPELVPIAEELRAPAEVSGGVVYVSDRQGEWKPAEAVPEDEWVMAGEHGELLLTLANGSKAKLEPNCLFRVGRDGASQRLLVQFLRGNGEIDTTGMTDNMFVRSGEAGFYAMPESRFEIMSELAATQLLRSWTRPERVNATVYAGDVVLWPEAKGYNKLPLKGGDKVEWTPEDLKVYTQSGKTLPVSYGWFSQPASATFHATELERGEVYRTFIELQPRIKALRARIETLPKQGDPRAAELRMQFLSPIGDEGFFELVLEEGAGINDSARIELNEEGVKRVIVVHTDGVSIGVSVDGAVRQNFESESISDLKTCLPAEIAELLNGVKFVKDAQGMHRIESANIEGRNAKVIVTSRNTPSKKAQTTGTEKD